MKKRVTFILVLFITLMICCGSKVYAGSPPSDNLVIPSPTNKTSLKLASHDTNVEGNTFRIVYEREIEEAAMAAKEACGFDISYACFISNWDAATEAQQLENSINEGYDIILVNPCAPTGLDPIIDKALDAGITYINVDCEYYSDRILNVCTDQYMLGYDTSIWMGETLGKGTKVVLINAIRGNAANDQREQGFEDGIAEMELDVVGRYYHDWSPVKAQEVMTQIISSGIEFEGVLISECAEEAIFAYQNLGAPWPKALGFGDTGQWMRQMANLNKDGRVMDYLTLSNPPGVGASGLNIGLNLLKGHEFKENIFNNPEYNSIYLLPQFRNTYDNQDEPEIRKVIDTLPDGEAVSYWLTFDEIKAEFFK